MVINELFYSIQGEGRLAGVPSIFIRIAGCPLRCHWCDTLYAQSASAGQKYSPDWLLEQVRSYPATHIVVTGGEPMVQPKLPLLLKSIQKQGIHLTVETAGIAFVSNLPCNLMSISPKLSNSTPTNPSQAAVHDQFRFNSAVLQQLIKEYPFQLKFVVDHRTDLDEIVRCVEKLGVISPANIFLMPQAKTRQEYIEKSLWLTDYCLQTGFSFGPRLQVMLWSGQRSK